MAYHVELPDGIIRIGKSETLYRILRTYRDYLVVVMLYRPFCEKCQLFTPILEQVREMYKEDVLFLKADLDVLSDMEDQFRVRRTPTVLFFFREKLRQGWAGVMEMMHLRDTIDALLSSIKHESY